MKDFITYKDGIIAAISVAGAFLADKLLGGIDSALTILCIFMAADYLTGLMVAGIFKRSGKSESGALESRAGWKGLCKKFATLLMVMVAVGLDTLGGTHVLRDGAVIAFALNEAISIIENVGLMGVPMPKIITDAIEVLTKRGE